MNIQPGDKVQDSGGNEWTVWDVQNLGTLGGHRRLPLVFSGAGEVKVLPEEALTKVEEPE